MEGDRPRIQEDDLNVEDDEEHRGQIEPDRESAATNGLGRGLDAALVGLEFGSVRALRTDQRGNADREECEQRCQCEQRDYRYVRGERHGPGACLVLPITGPLDPIHTISYGTSV